nr:hypothetical protein [Methanobrevibacter oralis]
MINKIANLSSELRMEGLPVSIRSTQAAVKIYMDLGGDDRNLLKTALMSIYVKDRYDIPKFNKVFEKLFAVDKGTKEIFEEASRGKAYQGTGPRSNKYIIKKQGDDSLKFKKEEIDNKNLKCYLANHYWMKLENLKKMGN